MEPETYYCGELVALEGLERVARLLASCSWPIALKRSRYDGTLYLQASSDRIDLDMDSGQTGIFLFSGIVAGSDAEAQEALEEFSLLLAAGNVIHRLEMYRDASSSKRLAYRHFGWPEVETADADVLRSISLDLPWERTTEPLENQLYRELGPDHPLFGIAATAIARRVDNDDVLFVLSNASWPLAVVHLSWTPEAALSAPFPATEFYTSLMDWLERRMEPDRTEPGA